MSTRRDVLQESLAAIERLQARLRIAEQGRNEPIAIIGAGCRFPGGIEDLDGLWRVLDGGINAVSDIPADRWDVDAWYDPDPRAPGKMSTRRGGFLSRVDQFDPQFFGISPREASTMDPQQRLLLETAWEALECAAISPDQLVGSLTGVFVGITTSDYGQLLRLGAPESSDVYSATGVALNAAAGRLAFVLGLQGPCAAVDTACSSSLVAVHLACQSLRAGESDLALAAGVNVILSPDAMVLFSKWGMMAPDGHCKTFDARADGFVRGEGCAAIALKRLSDAQAAGDPILAVIKGSAMNQDGRSSGLTVPNGLAQQQVIRAALRSANLEPGDIDYVEAHGTGTSLGDPIEVEALGAALGKGHSAARPLLIGSVKTNLGHTEAASGLAGLLKVVLSLQHEVLPAHLHFREPSPRIPWDSLPLAVTAKALPWQRGDRVRRAGVSSFGFSGTNAHVILEEAPPAPAAGEVTARATLVATAARDEAALRALAERHLADLRLHPDKRLVDRAYTAAAGRAHGRARVAFVADTSAGLDEGLTAWLAGTPLPGTASGELRPGESPRIAFLFTGQGAQYHGMGRTLYESEPVFRAALDRCAALLDPSLPQPLLEVLYGPASNAGHLGETGFTQPALFAFEYALAQLWQSWGIVPSVVMGHSVGEFVAASIAGIMTLESAIELIATRARLMQALPAGGVMASIFTPIAEVEEAVRALGGTLAIAARNGPEHVVVSGSAAAVDQVIALFEPRGVRCQRLAVSHAFHSPLVEPMLDQLEQAAARIAFAPPRLTMISNLTGAALPVDARVDASYWRRHAREAVRFHDSVEAAMAAGCDVMLEVGPAPVLLSMASNAFPGAGVTWLASLRKGKDDRREMLATLGELYVRGAPVNWEAVAAPGARRIALPTYPFQRERFWISAPRRTPPAREGHPLIGVGRALASPPGAVVWESELSFEAHPWLADHCVQDAAIVPATAYIEMALAAARQRRPSGSLEVTDIQIRKPILLGQDTAWEVQLILQSEGEGWSFAVYGRPRTADASASWTLHVSGRLAPGADGADGGLDILDQARQRCRQELRGVDFYESLHQKGNDWGPSFQGLERVWIGEDEAVGRVRVPAGIEDGLAGYLLHPAVSDAFGHTLVAALSLAPGNGSDGAFVGTGMGTVHFHQSMRERSFWVHARVHRGDADSSHVVHGDVRAYDDAGALITATTGVRLRHLDRHQQQALVGAATREWAFEVEWRAQPLPQPVPGGLSGRWIVFADGAGVGQSLAKQLEARGDAVLLVERGRAWHADGTRCVIDPADPAQFRRLVIEAAERDPRELLGVLFLWPLDEAGRHAEFVAVEASQERLLTSSLHLAQSLPDVATRLWFVTRGTQPVSGTLPELAQAPAWGFAGVAASELPALHGTRIDLDPVTATDDDARILLDTVTRPDAEDRVAWRGPTRYVARLVPANTAPADDTPRRLEIDERGTLSNLVLREVERPRPGPGQVEIRVHATGLNFRDVLNALGMYPGDPGPLGNECAGVVTAVGDGVTDLQAGDDVVAMVDRSFATWVLAPEALTVLKPASLTHAEAATVPITFLTAQYALRDLARIKKGDRVLIHAVTGGVGMAALQLALQAGAEVFGTAGSPAKRALARSLGAHHVADSRSPSFEEDVRRATNGEGVDIVLNSLAGDFIPASLRLLRRGGHFIEIGKTAIWDTERVAREFPGLQYHVLYLGEVAAARPLFLREMLRELLVEVDAGRLTALPLRTWPIERAEEAFRFMGQGQHTGKIVITQHPPVTVRGDATYLVTGGLSGLGLACARGLVAAGARHLVLVGRRAPSPGAEAAIADMRASGAAVTVAQADVADVTRLGAVIESIDPPLRGVLHAAGSTDDGVIAELTAERFKGVLAPKVAGAWNLHRLTARSPLDFFVLFSSGAALLGSPGQGNYAAANTFMDALAHRRRERGEPALSINWGSWSEVGMAAALDERHRRRWAAMGLEMISPEEGVRMLLTLLTANRAAEVAALPLNRTRLPGHLGLFYSELLVPGVAGTAASRTPGAPQEKGWRERLEETAPNRRRVVLREQVRQLAARVLGLSKVNQLNVDEPLRQLGLDSLMAVELRNLLGKEVGQVLPATITFDHPSVAALVEYLATTQFATELATPADTVVPETVPDRTRDLDTLNQDELAAELLSRLDGIRIEETS